MKLRAFTANDMDLMSIWLNRPHIRSFFGDSAEWIDEISANLGAAWVSYYIVETEYPIGFAQYYETDKAPLGEWSDEPAGTVGIDYLIGSEELTGKGHGSAIVGLLIAEVRRKKQYQFAIADPVESNVASARVLEKNGFSLQSNGIYRLVL